MDKPPPDKIILLAFLFALSLFLFSCAEEKMQVSFADAKVILDYEEGAAPIQRLSVFIKFSSNVRRVESVTVKNSDYSWIIQNPIVFEGGKESWAGYMHLEAPPNLKKIPQGKYEFECVDSTGEKSNGSFTVEYDEDLLNEEFSPEYFRGASWVHRVAVYSEVAELLYFDKPKDGWANDERVFSFVKNSDFLRNIYERQRTVCIGPKIYKDTPERREKQQQAEQDDGAEEVQKEGEAENAV